MKIKTKIILLVVVSIAVSLLTLYLFSYHSLNTLLDAEVQKYQKTELEKHKNSLKNLDDLAYKVVEKAYNDSKDTKEIEKTVKGKLETAVGVAYASVISIYKEALAITGDEEAAKLRTMTKVRALLSKLRYGRNNEGYFWINDLNGIMIAHPSKPQLNGKNLYNMKDKKNHYFFQEMIKACKEKGEGFVRYWWPKPGEDKPSEKLSYVKLIKDLDWIIGTGAYLDNVEPIFKARAINAINKLRYGKSGYFWINDLNGVIIVHPIKPQLNGKNLYNLKDKKGNFIFKPMIKVCKEKGEGFVKYWWPRPGSTKPAPKLSYVKLFKPWGWVIGTGSYIDDIQKTVIAKQKLYNAKKASMAKSSLLIFIVLLIVLSIIGIFLSNKFIKPLDVMRSFIADLSTGQGDLTKRIDYSGKDEIGMVATAFHKFVDKLQDMILNIGFYSGKADVATDKIMLSSVLLNKISDSQKVSIEETSSGILEMSRSINEVKGNVENTFEFVNKLETSIEEVSSETDNLIRNSNELIKQVKDGSNIMRNMANAMDNVQEGADTISDANRSVIDAGEIVKDKIEQTSNAIDKIKLLIDEVSTAINEQTASIEEVAKNSNDTLNVTREAQAKAQDGKSALDKVLTSMTSIKDIVGELGDMIGTLEESANNINEITNMINEISDQTNLLALNAAIEAARAGEAGKGFAVVADEVRKLAERSSKASSDIAELITGIQKDVGDATTKMEQGLKQVDEGVELTNEANKTIDEIVDSTNEALNFVSQINNATEEQASVSRGIIKSVESLIEQTESVESVQNELKYAGEDIVNRSSEMLEATNQIKELISHQNELKNQMDNTMETMNGSSMETQSILDNYQVKIKDIIEGIPVVLDGIKSVKIALDEQAKVADRIAALAEESVELSNKVSENSSLVYKEVEISNKELDTLNNEFRKFKFKDISFLSFAATQHLKNIISVFIDVEQGRDVSSHKKDHKECFCGKWLYGKGQRLLGNHPKYNDLLNAHKNVHDKLNEYIETKDSNLKDEVLKLSNELSEMFIQLYKELSNENQIVEVK